MINRVTERKFHEVEFWKNLFHGGAHKGIKPKVVVQNQKATAFKVSTQIACFKVAKKHISMSGSVYNGVVEHLSATWLHGCIFRSIKVGSEVFVAEFSEVF